MDADIEINLPPVVKKLGIAGTHLLYQIPHMIALLVVVGVFVFYIDRQEERFAIRLTQSDKVDDLRIDTCHAVQEQSVTAVRDLTEQMGAQAESHREMTESMRDLGDIIRNRM